MYEVATLKMKLPTFVHRLKYHLSVIEDLDTDNICCVLSSLKAKILAFNLHQNLFKKS